MEHGPKHIPVARWQGTPAEPLVEAHLIACVLKDRPYYLARSTGLHQDAFSNAEHRRLWVELHARVLSPWAVDLAERLGPLEPTGMNFLKFKDTVFRCWVRRRFREMLIRADEAASRLGTDRAAILGIIREAQVLLETEATHDPDHVLATAKA